MIRKMLLSFVISLFFSSFAWAASSSFGEQKSAPQYYQQANDPINPLVSQKATPADLALASDPIETTRRVAKDSSDSANGGSFSTQGLAVLQAEVSQVSQNHLMFQQKSDDRFIDLNSKYHELGEQINQLAQAMSLLNQEVAQLNKAVQQQVAQSAVSAESRQKKVLGMLAQIADSPLFKWILAAGLLVVLLLAWAFWPKEEKSTPLKKESSKEEADAPFSEDDTPDDTKDEYDYMGSVESMPAKLDLARTYLAMEDYRAARAVLQEVLKQGGAKQREQAKKLLSEIKAS